MTETDIKIKHIKPNWDAATLLSHRLKLRRTSVHNAINLMEDGATIPFIARYRKDQTDDMGPDLLREVANGLEELRSVETKMQTVYSSVAKLGKMTKDLESSLALSTSILEVETLYAPFKPGHKGTYAERARALGLEPLALDILANRRANLRGAVILNKKGVESVGEVEKGIKHIIADIVSKDKEIVEEAHSVCDRYGASIESSQTKTKIVQDKKKEGTGKQKVGQTFGKVQESTHKFEQYFNFKIPVAAAKPHQILALNRGEDLKILLVKIVIPDRGKTSLINFAQEKFLRKVLMQENNIFIRDAILDSYERLIEPMMCRQIRSDLTKNAEKASVAVFTSNLKNLLLVPPIKNKTIFGIDPGFKNGCKVAVISPTGQVVDTGVIYMHDYKANKMDEMNRVARLINEHRCEIIAIGNGVACRETEQMISNMIKQGIFKHHNIVYCIVDECGASIYSVSAEAKEEFPKLDPTLRGAVSIARRLQDPLAELVKIEPKHLGVGMYQHDLNKTKLQNALSSVVEECVSFVGVDLNTCSECLLRRVAGLNGTKAKNLLEWRAKNGHFTNRQQLLGIKGLGKKGFEQCAGFVRINHPDAYKKERNNVIEIKDEEQIVEETIPNKGRKRKAGTAGQSKRKKVKKDDEENWNLLDATAIHPESYELAHELALHLGVDLAYIGTEDFIGKVKTRAYEDNLKTFSEKKFAGLATVRLIADALKQPLSYDCRENFQRPLFKQEVTSVSDLRCGSEVTGRVTNVTHFGAFVDIGVGINGLIHTSKFGRHGKLGLGDHVEVKVENIDLDRKRIGLVLNNVTRR